MASRIKKGDAVAVISGRHRGETGTVMDVLGEKERVRIEGVNPIKRHLKPGRDLNFPQGGIVERFGTIHMSNVQPVDPSDGKPTRIGYKLLDDGKKVRVAKRSGDVLDH